MISYFNKINGLASNLTKEVFEDLINRPFVKKRVELISVLSDHDAISRAKKSLPAITWQAYFNEGEKRSNENAQLNGLFIVDFDHIEKPIELYDKIKNLEELNNKILVAHITPSGHGLRLVLSSIVKGTIKDNQQNFNDILKNNNIDVSIDTAVKDYARLSFVVPKNYILKLDDSVFSYNSDEIIKDDNFSENDTISDNIFDEKGYSVDMLYKNIPYKEIVEKLVIKMGGTPQLGERNTKLYQIARMLRYITDFNASLLYTILPDFGLPKSEVKEVVKSALKGQRSTKIPYTLYEILGDFNNNSETTENELEKIKIPKNLPFPLDLFVKSAPADFKKPIFCSFFPIIGTILSRLRSTYIDNSIQSPTFLSCIIAQQASGKSFTRNINDYCLKSIQETDNEYRLKEHLYKELLRKNKNNKSQPEKPKTLIRLIPASVSIAKLLERMESAKGLHLFSFTEEIDTITKSNSAGAWAQKTDIYRNAFDNAQYGQDYMSENTYSTVVNMFYNMLFLGTPNSVDRFFKNTEDGLVSRVYFSCLPDQFGKKMPVWKILSDKQKRDIYNFCKSLDEEINLTPEGEVKPVYNIDMRKHFKTIEKWLEEKRMQSIKDDSKAIDIFRRRAAVIAFRAGMVTRFLFEKRNCKHTTLFTNEIIKFVAEDVLINQLTCFGNKLEDSLKGNAKGVLLSGLFNELPKVFSKYDVDAIAHKYGKSTPTRVIISRWKSANLIKKDDKNLFVKL